MRDRLGVEAASASALLGMLADSALVAVLHFKESGPVSERDREALQSVRDLLDAVAQVSSRSVSSHESRRSMAPLAALGETVQAVTSAREGPDHGNLSDAIGQLTADLEAVLNGTANDDVTARLRRFLDRLAEITLARTEELARPGRETRSEWIKTASPS